MGHDLHLPADGAPTAAAVVVHPHPAMGGDRHHPLVVAVCEGLAAVGVAALRVDLRDPDAATSARELEALAVDLRGESGADRVVLVGYSWGSAVAAWAAPDGLVARVLVAPPVAMLELGIETRLASDEIPTLLLVPAHDQYGPPDEVRAAVGDSPNATVEVVEGADHFLAGAVARIASRTVAWISEQL